MALKSELGEADFDLFDAWSKGGAKYTTKATRDTWRNVKAGGRVRIGTLIHLAKEHGYRPESAGAAPAPAVSPEELKTQRIATAKREERKRKERDAAHAEAAAEAARLWEAASEAGESGYLSRKRVRGHGVRYAADGWLVIPLRDAEGRLWNVQRIAPAAPSDGPEKLLVAASAF